MNNEAEWIEWNGGECPVKEGTLLDVMYRDGHIETGIPALKTLTLMHEATSAFWSNDGASNDIIAYRLHDAFNDAPDWATHLLTTGPEWDSPPKLIGTVEPALLRDNGMFYEDEENDSSTYIMGEKYWTVAATRMKSDCENVDHDGDYVEQAKEYTGGSVSYYTVDVANPTNPDVTPYQAECNDIIEALGMNYAEGNAFKAIWRKCSARTIGKAKDGYKDGLYDSEKVVFFGQRMVEQERSK